MTTLSLFFSKKYIQPSERSFYDGTVLLVHGQSYGRSQGGTESTAATAQNFNFLKHQEDIISKTCFLLSQ